MESCYRMHQNYTRLRSLYAQRFAERFRGTAGHPFEHGFDLTLRPERLMQPLRWKKPRRIFVNSMSDLFHKNIPIGFIDSVFDTMEAADHHIFQVLTKRSSLMRNYLCRRYGNKMVSSHIWCGVSIEDNMSIARVNIYSLHQLPFVFSRLNLCWVLYMTLILKEFHG